MLSAATSAEQSRGTSAGASAVGRAGKSVQLVFVERNVEALAINNRASDGEDESEETGVHGT